MSLEYRAVFIDPDDNTVERPIQIFGSNWQDIEAWANKKLETGGPNSFVEFYQTSETRTGFRRRPKQETPAK